MHELVFLVANHLWRSGGEGDVRRGIENNDLNFALHELAVAFLFRIFPVVFRGLQNPESYGRRRTQNTDTVTQRDAIAMPNVDVEPSNYPRLPVTHTVTFQSYSWLWVYHKFVILFGLFPLLSWCHCQRNIISHFTKPFILPSLGLVNYRFKK